MGRIGLENRVSCECDGLRGTGTFEVEGDWLVLTSTLGEHRVRLGLANPRKLAAKLVRNLCKKAAAAAASDRPSVASVSDKANHLVDIQRDKIVAMPTDDPQRAAAESLLDTMIGNARAIGEACEVLAPPEAAAIAPEAEPVAPPAAGD